MFAARKHSVIMSVNFMFTSDERGVCVRARMRVCMLVCVCVCTEIIYTYVKYLHLKT